MRRWQRLKVLLATLTLALSPFALTTSSADTVDIVHDGYGAQDVTTFWAAGYEGADVMAGVYLLDKTAGTGIGNTCRSSSGESTSICKVEPSGALKLPP